jgi:hypothetical protein
MDQLVHFNEGPSRVMSGEELNELDPTLWHAAEPADRPRHITMPSLNADMSVTHTVIDRETGETVSIHDDRHEAAGVAAERNMVNPLLSAVTNSGDTK